MFERSQDEASAPSAFSPAPGWLDALRDAYAALDAGIEESIARAAARGKTPACFAGCTTCCEINHIPLTQMEMQGIASYCLEELPPDMRRKVRRSLIDGRRGLRCPFLIGSLCAIYPFRPFACRQYVIFNTPCAPGEMVTETRWDDVLKPAAWHRHAAFAKLLPFYGISTPEGIAAALRDDFLFSVSSTIQSIDWKPLYRALAARDKADAAGS